jgi:hypothetical protein
VSVTGAAAGAYTLLVGNVGPDDDSIAFQVVLTPTTSSTGVGASIRKGSGGFLVPYPRP